jgi:hypothetical protein
LEALQAVLKDAKEQNVTHYACLGDVVGYGANPKECLQIVRDMKTLALKAITTSIAHRARNPEALTILAVRPFSGPAAR